MPDLPERLLIDGPFSFVLNEQLRDIPGTLPGTVRTLGLIAVEVHGNPESELVSPNELALDLDWVPARATLTVVRAWSGFDIFSRLRVESANPDGGSEDFVEVSVDDDLPTVPTIQLKLPQRIFPVIVFPLRTSEEMRRARDDITKDAAHFFRKQRRQ